MTNIGLEIKARRKQLGMTQLEAVGDMMSISKLSNIENGKIKPDPETWHYLKTKLGLSDDLFKDDAEADRVEFLLEQAATYRQAQLAGKAKEKYLEIIHNEDSDLFYKKQTAHAYKELALIYIEEKDYKKAIPCIERAEKLFGELDDLNNLIKCEIIYGTMLYSMGKFDEAIHAYTIAVKHLEKENDKGLLGTAYYNMASVYYWLNKMDQANYACEKAINLLDEKSIHYASALTLQAILYKKEKFFLLAREKLLEARDVSSHTKDSWLKAKYWHNLGQIELELKNYEKALEYFRFSLEIKEQLSDGEGIIRTNCSLAELYLNLGDMEQALEYAQEAVKLSRQFRLHLEEIIALTAMCKIHTRKNDEVKFLDSVFKALFLADQMNMRNKKVELLELMAVFYNNKNDHEKCKEKLYEAFLIKQEIADKVEVL